MAASARAKASSRPDGTGGRGDEEDEEEEEEEEEGGGERGEFAKPARAKASCRSD